VHVIAGTTFGFFDGQERRDRYDLVECAAEQLWSDGNVSRIGMPELGISRDTKPESGQGIIG
jgi:predicted acyl esterase